MRNYLKWELKNYIKTKSKLFLVMGIVYLLLLIFPINDNGNVFSTLIILSTTIIFMISLYGTYIGGTKYSVDTFSKKTFLLESLIPVPAKKILLSKYILGIIINSFYILSLIIGLMIILIKGVGLESTLSFYKIVFENINFETVLTIICSSIFFLSAVILGFVSAKALKPGGRQEKIIGFIFAFLIVYFTSYIMFMMSSNDVIILNIVYLIVSTAFFFITSYLIENKLEVYN